MSIHYDSADAADALRQFVGCEVYSVVDGVGAVEIVFDLPASRANLVTFDIRHNPPRVGVGFVDLDALPGYGR